MKKAICIALLLICAAFMGCAEELAQKPRLQCI